MWVDRKMYDSLRMDYVKANEEARVLNNNYTALMTTLDWLRVRVTQLEMERAQLVYNYMGIKLPTPVIARTDERPDPNISLPNFEDVGDKEAARLGLGWNADGTLAYESK